MWRLPKQFVLAGHYKYQRGFPFTPTLTVTRSIDPGLTQVTQPVALVSRGEQRLPDINLLDFRLSRVFGLGSRVKFEPLLDVYNVTNVGVALGVNQAVGPNLGNPSDTLDGRIARFGAKLTF